MRLGRFKSVKVYKNKYNTITLRCKQENVAIIITDE